MARGFTRLSNHRIVAESVSGFPVTTVPLTISLWYQNATAAQGGNRTLFFLFANSTNTHRCGVQLTSTGVLQIVALGSATATPNGGIFNDATWYHVAAVFSASNSRTLYVDGISRVTNTVTVTQNAFDSLAVGALPTFGTPTTYASHYGDGDMMEIGVWNAALNADEVNALYRGFTCDHVKPGNLQIYLPLIRGTPVDRAGGVSSFTENGTLTNTTHNRVY